MWDEFLKTFLTLISAILLAGSPLNPPAYAQMSASSWGQGGIRIGTSTTTCNSGAEGGIRYSSVTGSLEACNGTAWQSMVANSCDNAPGYFAFTDQTNLGPSSQYSSNIVAVTGMDVGCATSVGVGGQGTPEYRVCSDSGCSTVTTNWTTSNNNIAMQGNYIQLRGYTSATAGTTHTITASINVVSSDWKISTTATDCSLSAIGTVCTDGSVYAGTSPDGSVPMYVMRCDVGQSWSGAACTGTRTAMDFNNGQGTYGYNIDTILPNCGSGLGCDSSGANSGAVLAVVDADNSIIGIQNHIAAKYCDDLNLHGYSDWYLPSPPELDVVHTNKTAISNFDTTGPSYWTTGESANYLAWLQTFTGGAFATSEKSFDRFVRCARRNVDIIPSSLSFTDQTGLAASVSVDSNIFQVAGITGTAKINVFADSGSVLPQYRVCADATCTSIISAWGSVNGLTISNNQYLQLRAHSPAAAGTTRNITAIVGGSNDIWSLSSTTSNPCSGSPSIGAVCNDGTVYAGLSPDGNVAMYVTRCDVGQTWNSGACTGARQDKAFNNGGVNYVNTAIADCATAGGCTMSGETNTATMVATDSDNVVGGTQPHESAAACDDLTMHGQTDWYVPSAPELNVIYTNAAAIGNTDGGQYGSSSEFDINSNWLQVFSDGSQIRNYFGATKNQQRHIRCARR